MFQKTRVRLAALNTLVLFVILSLFGGVIYVFSSSRLYVRVDFTLAAVANRLKQEQYRNLTRQSDDRPADRKVVILLWNKAGHLLAQMPPDAFFASELAKFGGTASGFRNVTTADGHSYRALSVPLTQTSGAPGNPPEGLSPDSTLLLVMNIDPEAHMLSDLVMIIAIGSLSGGVVSLLAGLFLANRALIPIKKSWDKQQEFVTDASHELRTPLSVIQGHLELLFRHPDHTIEQDSEKLSAVLTEVKRMIKMVTQLLTLARSDSNQTELETTDFGLGRLISDIAEQFRTLAETKNISIETLLDENMEFNGDKQRINQLVVILLDNALKFTPESGRIRIIGSKARHGIKISVEDTGPGIPAKDLPLIFDRFYRGDKVRRRSSGGTGLGLAIAKWIVKAHNGEIWVESKPGEGTRIHISLPLKRPRQDKNVLLA